MVSYYWVVEYSKVFCAYLFLMFLWPSVVFHEHLRLKSKTYRFGFCVTVPIVIMNTVVLGLGLLHGLRQWPVEILFYGVFVLAFLKNFVTYLDRKYRKMMEAEFPNVRSLTGKYRKLVIFLLFFVVCYKYVKRAVRFLSVDFLKKIKTCNWTKTRLRLKEEIWNFVRRISSLFWRYGILAIVLVYGMAYFSYGAFQVNSYGYGDLYTHHKWIYGLIEGNIFADGIYPQAMHCFIYCMHMLFGIRIYSILLFLQGIHVAVFLVSVYLLLRKVFSWRYTAVFVLMMFLTLDLYNADLIHSMFRLQITMPMEFGLHTVCLSALFLLNYLERKQSSESKYFWDENLFLFMMALATVTMTHFHVLLMTMIVCASFAVFSWKKICSRKYLLPLISAVFCGAVIAVTPMAGAVAQGTPFSASIEWALDVMRGEESKDEQESSAAEKEENTDIEKEEDTEKIPEEGDTSITQSREAGMQDMKRSGINIADSVLGGMTEIYDKGYALLYGWNRGGWALALTVAMVVFCLLTKKKLKRFREICRYYPPVILISVLYVFLYAAPIIGLPNLIPEGRFFAPGHMMLLGVMLMPADMVFSGLAGIGTDLVMRLASFAAVAGIYGAAVATGNFRGMLFYELSRYNAAVEVTESIIDTFPQYSYTIVSPTDELYPVIQYGWHEELLSFVERCGGEESYSIPSEHVFIFVEKKPLLYAQSYFFQRVPWMGEEKYLEPFWSVYAAAYPDSAASQAPKMIVADILELLDETEDVKMELPEYGSAWEMYLKLENRTVLEAMAYDWCQRFAKEHPSVMNVFYEDDAFVCYYFRQETGAPAYVLNLDPKETY